MSLPGPSRTITVEPIEVPDVPRPQREPDSEPEREPAPAEPEPQREPEPVTP